MPEDGAGLAMGTAQAWWGGPPPSAGTTGSPLTKRTLVTLSHAIERGALVEAADRPLVMVSLFQRLPYFDRERPVYAELAANSDVLVIGFVDDFRPQLAGRAHPVLLQVDEPLAREWTVVYLTPHSGAYLTAYDQEQVAPGGTTLEAGRLFTGAWGFDRGGARAVLRRLRRAMADRVPPGALGDIDALLDRDELPPADIGDASYRRLAASIGLLVAQMETARRQSSALTERLSRAVSDGSHDPMSQLPNAGALEKWVGAARTATSGPLPVALALVSIRDFVDRAPRFGARTERDGATAVAGILTRHVRPVDRVFRIAEDEFLVVAPGATEQQVAALAQQVTADVTALADSFPFVPYTPVTGLVVTRQRPLPLEDLRATVAWARQAGHSIALAR